METKSKKYFESNRMIIKIMRKIYLLCRIYKLIAFINTKRRNGVSKPYEPVYIPTDMIYKMINDKNSNKYRFYNQRYMIRKFGLIQNGDWDLDLFDITSLPIFELFQQRFIEKLRWENTNYYKKLEEKFKLNGTRRGCNSLEEYYEKNFKRWEKIYLNIEENGYKSQKELGNIPIYEIEVCISRNGDIIFVDGRHRLCMAKILSIKKIPVIINMWHHEFIVLFQNENKDKELSTKNLVEFLLRFNNMIEKKKYV